MPRKTPARITPARRSGARGWAPPVAIACAAALLLFWNLTDTYLWQDEANTAVLAVRLMKYGKPLAYDGRNLLSDDNFVAQDPSTLDERVRDPEKAVEDCIRRGTMTRDRMWTYHPWGQFVVAGLSIALLGPTTLAARLPFALAGLATVLALYGFVLRYFRSSLMAALASALLTVNVYWVLHSRQARYYSLSSLGLVLTLIAYARWQQGVRWGGAIFVVVAWCWFQVDYGTVWPVFGVLFVDAIVRSLRSDWRSTWKPVAAWLALAAAIAPYIAFYRLTTRAAGQLGTWAYRLKGTIFNLNEYVVPVIVLLAVLVLVIVRWRGLPALEARLVLIGCAIIACLAPWVATVAPTKFVRYVIMAAPVGAMLTAWLSVRGLDGLGPRPQRFAWVAIVALTPLLCAPLRLILRGPWWARTGTFVRSELALIGSDIFAHRPDPNRIVIEWLGRNAAPTDEILVNYEDLPMMYYLPNPIRGGIAAFRVEDDSVAPPAFAVMRRTVPFVHWPIFQREVSRYYWAPVPVKAPDIRWGNNPDPEGHLQDRKTAGDLQFYQRTIP